jgi:prepilin-type N-terminal cleavage/methylation domain-containing protein
MRAKIWRRLWAEAGFTLVELIASMAILSIAVVAFTQLFAFTIRRSGTTQEQATLQVETRGGLDALSRDLREALCNNTTQPVTTATASQITFYSPDEQTPYHLRQISYRLSGSNFQRELVTSTNTAGPPWTMPSLTGATWSTLFGSVTTTNPFTYRDANGNVTSTLSAITQVDVAFTVKPRATTSANDGTTPYNLSVDLRTPTCDTD